MSSVSSMPPVLDPRSAARVSPIPPSPNPREQREARESAEASPLSQPKPAPVEVDAAKPARPPAVLAKDFTSSRSERRPAWTAAETAKLVSMVAVPAATAFAAVLMMPALGTPLGRALRGDSTLASGVLAVFALVFAAALCARSMLGERSRWLYVAAAGGVLFGIVMIIVTFAASEAAELGVPSSMAGLSTLVAPIAPLAVALGALGRARAVWTDPYSRGEAIRHAALASLMLFLTLALSPVGAVRTSRPPQAPRGLSR
jgi:hypothetical protein